jgi:hypothetical protein
LKEQGESMKSVFLAVIACCVGLFSSNHALAFTYEGSLNPNELYAWEWKVFDTSSELGVDLIKAKNPKEDGYPDEVMLIVMRESENILVIKNQIVGYFYGEDLTKTQFFMLDEEKNHYFFEVTDLSDDEIVGTGKKLSEEERNGKEEVVKGNELNI